VIVAAACSGGGGAPSAPRTAVTPGRWVAAQASFDPPLPRSAGPQIQEVISVPGGWAALGSPDGHGFASWRSGDGVHWRRTQQVVATPANSTISISTVVWHDADLVAAGWSGQHAAVWVSRNEGRSWACVLSNAFKVGSTVNAAVVVHGAVVLVGGTDAVNNTESAWIMRDDAHVAAATVSSTGVDAVMTGVVDLGDRLVAVGNVTQYPASWVSRDGGASWQAASVTRLGGGLQQVVQLHGQLVASGPYYRSGGVTAAGFVWQSSDDERMWRPVVRRSGSFGDGRDTNTGQLVAFRNAALMAGVVEDRTNPNFCYDDVATCAEHRPMLWLSSDGSHWARVAVDGTTASDTFNMVAIDTHGFLLVGYRFDPSTSSLTTRVWRWIGTPDEMPASVVPPDQQPRQPRHELILRYDATLVPGRTYRFPVPLGSSCGGGKLDFNATQWKTTQAWGDGPYPKSWPVRHENVSDGPTDYLYGTVRVVDSRHLQVGLERGPVLRTYEPTAEHVAPCA
jgi:hypothetical protein